MTFEALATILGMALAFGSSVLLIIAGGALVSLFLWALGRSQDMMTHARAQLK